MQNNNLLKKAILALLLCVAMPCVNAQMAHIGDILCEGDLIVSPANYNANTHTAMGVVFYVDQTGQHGWAIALEDAGTYKWGSYTSDTPLQNYTNKRQAVYDLDGYENTRIVREHNTDHPAFYAVDFESGWYVPTIGQWNYFYGNIKEMNTNLQIVGGVMFEESTGWEYWSSSECTNQNAWWLSSSGELCSDYDYNYYGGALSNKMGNRRVRAVRNF